jgi:hypothetical protein
MRTSPALDSAKKEKPPLRMKLERVSSQSRSPVAPATKVEADGAGRHVRSGTM